MSEYEGSSTIFLQPEEFAQDAQPPRLGRANGNTYQRKLGVEGMHDGQIMVRLKKKRFIIIDYGYIPNANDYEIAKAVPHISIPTGAGRAQCSMKDCSRIGVPCLMYDSEPNEPMSLYLRGGMCFSCQRINNEKRRTQRKRKSDGLPVGEVRVGGGDMPSIGSGSGNNSQRFRFNDQIVELNPDAVVINGPVDGTRTRGQDYRYPAIGSDLIRIIGDLSHETLSLAGASGMAQGMTQTGAPASSVDALYQRAFLSVSKATFLLTQWKASWDENRPNGISQTTATDATSASANFDSRMLEEAVAQQNMHHAAGFLGLAHEAAAQPLLMPDNTPTSSSNSHLEI